MNRLLRATSMILTLAMMPAACGGPELPTKASRVAGTSATAPLAREARFDAQELLDVINSSASDQPARIPGGVQPGQVEAAFNKLQAKLKPKASDPAVLEADAAFAASLTPSQKSGLDKLARGYAAKVRDQSIKPKRRPDGGYDLHPGNGQNGGQGDGRSDGEHDHGAVLGVTGGEVTPEHSVGDGRWSWSTSYSWWGVKVSANHNFLWYLCRYTSWMLTNSGLPGWIKTVLGWLACAPHNADGGLNGATVYITWAGAFWYYA